MKRILILLSVCILLSSCEKRIGGPVPDTTIYISYTNFKNADLLNPKTASHLTSDDIEVHLLTQNGERRRVYNGRMDMPKMFRIENRENDKYILTLFFEPEEDCFDKNIKATMYLSYKNAGEDKFVGQFNRTKFPRTLEKLWVNDKLVSDQSSSSSQRLVNIIK